MLPKTTRAQLHEIHRHLIYARQGLLHLSAKQYGTLKKAIQDDQKPENKIVLSCIITELHDLDEAITNYIYINQ